MTEQPTNATEQPTQAEGPVDRGRPGEVRTKGETTVDDAIGASDDPEE